MKRIAIVGFKGKMGSLIRKVLQDEYLLCLVGKEDSLENFFDVDLVIDFGSHESSVKSAEFALAKNIPVIIGSTGQTQEEIKKLNEISKKIRVIRKANFSSGIDVLKKFIDEMITLGAKSFKIIEKHHIHKRDSPSGTALELKEYIAEKFSGKVEISSIREGEEMGEHKIIADFGSETLMITHNINSREAFVKGIVREINKLIF